jgi:hypothetical protein
MAGRPKVASDMVLRIALLVMGKDYDKKVILVKLVGTFGVFLIG